MIKVIAKYVLSLVILLTTGYSQLTAYAEAAHYDETSYRELSAIEQLCLNATDQDYAFFIESATAGRHHQHAGIELSDFEYEEEEDERDLSKKVTSSVQYAAAVHSAFTLDYTQHDAIDCLYAYEQSFPLSSNKRFILLQVFRI